jgi:hypothetical protein
MFGLNGVDTHQRGFMCFSVIYPNWQASSEIGAESFQLYYGQPHLAGKRLVRAMQCMQFRAKSAKTDLKPTDFLKSNFYFETEGVCIYNRDISKVKEDETMDHEVVPWPCKICDWLLNSSWGHVGLHLGKHVRVTMEFEIPKRHF